MESMHHEGNGQIKIEDGKKPSEIKEYDYQSVDEKSEDQNEKKERNNEKEKTTKLEKTEKQRMNQKMIEELKKTQEKIKNAKEPEKDSMSTNPIDFLANMSSGESNSLFDLYRNDHCFNER